MQMKINFKYALRSLFATLSFFNSSAVQHRPALGAFMSPHPGKSCSDDRGLKKLNLPVVCNGKNQSQEVRKD